MAGGTLLPATAVRELWGHPSDSDIRSRLAKYGVFALPPSPSGAATSATIDTTRKAVLQEKKMGKRRGETSVIMTEEKAFDGNSRQWEYMKESRVDVRFHCR